MTKSVERIYLFVTDFITINLAYITYFYFRVEAGWFQLVTKPEFLLPMFVIYLYWLLIFLFVGMYRTWFAASRFDELSTLFKTSFIGVFILFFLIFIDDVSYRQSSVQRYLIFIYWGIFLLYVGIGRIFVRSVQRRLLLKGIGRRNTIIIGYNDRAKEIFEEINSARALGLDVKGFILINEENNIPAEEDKILGKIDDIREIVKKYNIKEVIIALDRHKHDLMLDVIAKCDFNDLTIKIVPDLYEIISGLARTNQLYSVPLIEINPQLMSHWERKIKRLIDIVFSFVILIVTFPITLISAIAIKLDSKGPVLYKQIRVGKDGKEFNIYKFRSMYIDAEKHTGPVWSTKNDPRITRVGRFLRKVRIDEIPQLINVLRGEMSLVGPRPERPYFVEKLSKEIPLYKRRLKVKPGITGWAQVKHKYDESIEDVKKKVEYDLYYIENVSIKLDLIIVFRTIFTVLFGKGHFKD